MPKKYIVKLLKKETVAEGTMAFHFSKPSGFEYKSGQNADYYLINPVETDKEGNKRTFSFASSPEEKDIIWATRMRDTAFKRNMGKLVEGSEVEMEGPYGDMLLHSRSEKPAVFLAGGIGITLFHSMIKDASARNLPHKIFLFYSNRRPEDAPFLKELTELQSQNPNFKLIATMTDMPALRSLLDRRSLGEVGGEVGAKSSQPWDGEHGYITPEMIKKYLPQTEGSIYYLAGPPPMVASMRKILTILDVNDDDIRSEEYIGY